MEVYIRDKDRRNKTHRECNTNIQEIAVRLSSVIGNKLW